MSAPPHRRSPGARPSRMSSASMKPSLIPRPSAISRARHRIAAAIGYMGLTAGRPIEGLPVDVVFIGSCTNARLSDLADAAALARGRRVAPGCGRWSCRAPAPSNGRAEAMGLDRIFMEAGFEWAQRRVLDVREHQRGYRAGGVRAASPPPTVNSRIVRDPVPHASGKPRHGCGCGACGAIADVRRLA